LLPVSRIEHLSGAPRPAADGARPYLIPLPTGEGGTLIRRLPTRKIDLAPPRTRVAFQTDLRSYPPCELVETS
jgi:hypothetical protein